MSILNAVAHHIKAKVGVHSFDEEGNAPPKKHHNSAHEVAFAEDAQVLHKNQDEEIHGHFHFINSPTVPEPQSDNHLINKSYLDNKVQNLSYQGLRDKPNIPISTNSSTLFLTGNINPNTVFQTILSKSLVKGIWQITGNFWVQATSRSDFVIALCVHNEETYNSIQQVIPAARVGKYANKPFYQPITFPTTTIHITSPIIVGFDIKISEGNIQLKAKNTHNHSATWATFSQLTQE